MTPRKAFLERNQYPKEEVENTISQSAKYSYEYAKSLGERFPLGEPAICQDAKYAYKYTINVINRDVALRTRGERQRFPEAEPIISQSPEFSYKYARYVVNGRWEMGEHTISQNARYSFQYAQHVLKDRFPMGEETIINDTYYANEYAVKFVKDRWPEYENSLLEKMAQLSQINDKFYEDKQSLCHLINDALGYARDIIGGRWEEIEPFFAQNYSFVDFYAKSVLTDNWSDLRNQLLNRINAPDFQHIN